jgi:hypothetical protein
LKISFLAESPFPVQKGWSTSAKDKVISLLPDCPPRYNEEFHEEEMHA